ncbi:von Willebrand factor type A domain-containing protein [Streptomyces sp. MJP52]|uniref:vWA domain-containing protein n=1 Tax=Streptomyces sp. MJP52 TaxID=2940555 RepID=UPI002473971F|nr:von Willebrand factor type A domain-containing protein [Streptomyces sp. MJP52]MDH6225184.1 Ca-activated chloride channel family protein [Streptomyces sp. MJP52]
MNIPAGVRTGATGRVRLRALLAGATAAGLLLTGCGGGADDSASEAAQDKSVSREGAPAPSREADRGGDRLSTFALDVDTASYGYVRRTLADGRLPEPSTVRPEEFVNSFRQDYERPEGNGFRVSVDGAAAGDGGWALMRVGLATRPEPGAADDRRAPAALTFVVDVSGSMAEAGRLDLVRQGLRTMTGRLRDDDSVALVAFSERARTVLPMTRLGDGRDRVRDAVDRLEPDAATDLGAGVRAGYTAALDGLRDGATNRVVLMSDALANTGETDADALLEEVGHAREDHGITLFGVGVGSEYGDALMERLTNRGDGHTVYVSSPEEAERVFSEELPRNVGLTARDAKAQVAFDPSTVAEHRLIGYENRRVADEDFRDDGADGGEVGPGHTVTALYAVRLRGGASGRVAEATVRWLDPRTREAHEASRSLGTDELHRSVRDASARFQVTVVAAHFAAALRESDPGVATPTLPGLAEHADALARRTEDPQVRELAEAIHRAVALRGGE